MADSAVTTLIQHLSRVVIDHVNLRSGVKDKIMSLCRDLEFMEVFLKSSEGKRSHDLVKVAVRQIREVAFEAEDVIDNYVTKVNIQRSRNILKKLLHCTSHEMMLRDVDDKIGKIRITIEEIYRNGERYGVVHGDFQSGGDEAEKEAAKRLRNRRKDVEEEEVVGLVHDSTIVKKELLEASSCLNIVSIIGMGGLGKTTLAKKVYNNKDVEEIFPHRAWGYVSNEYRAKELLVSLLRCLMSSTSKYEDVNEEDLKKEVREYLNGKKYLIVLDDIWKTQVWDELKGAFPDDNMGSRILLTSREKEVASYSRSTLAYELPLLDEKESWELFHKKVFGGQPCPSELKDLGTSIVQSCRGLPLAIVVLSGMLAKKEKSQREWSRIKDHVSWHLSQEGNTGAMSILKLSYDNLPPTLKPCFLYFGLYPEDYEISAKDLIQLWMAEGFIPLETGTSNAPNPEDIAGCYLDELVGRNLIQVSSRKVDGSVKRCQIHDLLRDLCIREGKASNFLEVYSVSDNHRLSNARRLGVHSSEMFCTSSDTSNQSCTRSFLLLGGEYYGNHRHHTLKNFKLARVLHFGTGNFSSTPRDLKMMIHLRYLKINILSLRKKMTVCMSNIWNLETLTIKSYTDTMIVIRGMWKLKRLRHVSVFPCIIEGMPRADSETMQNLQTLTCLNLDSKSVHLLNRGSFPNLKKLGLFYQFSSESLRGERSPVKELQSLRYPNNLDRLSIFGTSKLPLNPTVFLFSLTKITLRMFDWFPVNSMITLGQLTNLQMLKLKFQIWNEKFDINCVAGEFPRLREFHMCSLYVKTWKLEKGAMPCLHHLLIDDCNDLYELPDQLWILTTLRQVHVIKSSRLASSLQYVEVSNGCRLIID